MPQCQALIQQGENKGKQCENSCDDKYCLKHYTQYVNDEAQKENIRYCDITRSCYAILEDHQTKCVDCVHKSKIRDRKRNDKKRQDSTLCLDCGNTLTNETRAKGKHDKELRRCIPCYEKLKRYESQREPRVRNYKAESFTNKHVAWNHYVKSAEKRSINFTLSKTKFNLLIMQPCYYCDYFKDSEVNGIDRINNNCGYTEDNVVSCCQACNLMKGTQHPQEFIDKLYTIHQYNSNKIPIKLQLIEKWQSTYLSKIIPKYSTYAKSANTRNLEFKLTEDEFKLIIGKHCYLCGLPNSDNNTNGIDRVNNNIGYIIDNCQSCCGHCNILKKDLEYSTLLDKSAKIFNKYDILTSYFNTKEIQIRLSKTEARIKVANPISQEPENRVYKPTNEIIIPQLSSIPETVKKILSKKIKELDSTSHKQWKVKQVYTTISENNENIYKEYCETNNDISKIPDWDTKWATFVLSIKGKSYQQSEEIIRELIEDLRRIRHNELCYNKNSSVVDRDDRQQWPATTVVRAFLDGKIDTFKKYTEEQTGDNPEDAAWQKRWNGFIKILEENKDNLDKLKDLCSKFMTAQRTKRYRRTK